MRPITILALATALGLGAAGAAAESPFWVGTSEPGDADAVVQVMREKGAQELPLEALAYYEQGITAVREGRRTEAVAHFESACRVDAAFPEAHLALARLHLFRNPRSAAAEIAAAFEATTRSFGAQHLALVNATLGFLIFALLSCTVLSLYLLARLLARAHHVAGEALRPWLPGPLAALAAGLALLAPFLWNMGILPPLFFLCGVLWFSMTRAERRWTLTFAALTVAAPVLLWSISPALLSPLDPGSPAFLVSRAMVSAPSDALVESVEAASKADPDNPSLPFALGMLEKRRDRFSEAAAAYERSLTLGGPSAAISNNLGVIAYHAGRWDDAIARFRSAVDENPGLASAHFNLSQAYAKKLYFDKADEELRQANRLAFRRIREVIKSRVDGTNGTLIDEPLPPSALWAEAWNAPRRLPAPPAWLRVLFPGSLAMLPALSILFLVAGAAGGWALHRSLPSFACSNCGRPVCRRCLRRIRRRPFCRACGEALLQIQSASYSRLVLDSRLRRSGRVPAVADRISGWVLPGYVALKRDKPDHAAAIVACFTLGFALLARGALPVTRLGWLEPGPGLWWPEVPVALLIAAEAASLITMWKLGRDRDEDLRLRILAPAEDEDTAGFANAA